MMEQERVDDERTEEQIRKEALIALSNDVEKRFAWLAKERAARKREARKDRTYQLTVDQICLDSSSESESESDFTSDSDSEEDLKKYPGQSSDGRMVACESSKELDGETVKLQNVKKYGDCIERAKGQSIKLKLLLIRTLRMWNIQFTGGAVDELNEFLFRVRECMTCMDLEEAEVLKILPCFLFGTAARWYKTNRSQFNGSWSKFESAIQSEFSKVLVISTISVAENNKSQDFGEVERVSAQVKLESSRILTQNEVSSSTGDRIFDTRDTVSCDGSNKEASSKEKRKRRRKRKRRACVNQSNGAKVNDSRLFTELCSVQVEGRAAASSAAEVFTAAQAPPDQNMVQLVEGRAAASSAAEVFTTAQARPDQNMMQLTRGNNICDPRLANNYRNYVAISRGKLEKWNQRSLDVREETKVKSCFGCGSMSHQIARCQWRIERKRPEVKCFVCQGVGHFARECTSKIRRGGSTCRGCGRPGVTIRTCPNCNCPGCGMPGATVFTCINCNFGRVPVQSTL